MGAGGRRATHLRIGAVVTTAVVTVFVAGCEAASTVDEANNSATVAAPTTSALAAPSGEDEHEAVVVAYDAFWARHTQIRDWPESTWDKELGEVAVDPQLTRTLQAMRFNRNSGITTYGSVTSRITEVEVDGDRATVTDCQDASRSGQADMKTGERKTVGVPRNPVTARMVRDAADGRWKVAEIRYPGGEC
ncbi:hypothetical protein FHX69_0163 [Prauserella muralis]|nr:hypothetical protein FHX69_0163 [Prauserella muralis]